MLALHPVDKSSTTRTFRPCPSKASTRCDPMKPAPPVTTAHFSGFISKTPVPTPSAPLFHPPGLRQIPRLIHVPPQLRRDVVGKQLKRKDRQNRRPDLGTRGNL